MAASIWNPRGGSIVANAENGSLIQKFIATAGQTLFTLTSFSYVVDTGSIRVYRNGNKLQQSEVSETSDTTFTLVGVVVAAGEIIEASAVLGSQDAVTAAALSAASSAAAASAAAASVTPVDEQTHAATAKSTPADNDEIPIVDSADGFSLKKILWSSIKTALNTMYMAIVTPGASGNLLTSTGAAWVSQAPAAAPVAASLPTGATISYLGSTAPSGYAMLSGLTIGNAASGATERANEDTKALFTLLWNSMANTEAAVSSGRGTSAAADFAANKTITLPDARGRTIAGVDSMGGKTAGRLTSAGAGIVGTTLGASGGAQTHVLTIAQMPAHTHTVPRFTDAATNVDALQWGTTNTVTNQATSSQGSSAAHQNTQPTLVLNIIVKL